MKACPHCNLRSQTVLALNYTFQDLATHTVRCRGEHKISILAKTLNAHLLFAHGQEAMSFLELRSCATLSSHSTTLILRWAWLCNSMLQLVSASAQAAKLTALHQQALVESMLPGQSSVFVSVRSVASPLLV